MWEKSRDTVTVRAGTKWNSGVSRLSQGTRSVLPCPDVVSDGIDGGVRVACAGTDLEGMLLFQTLRVPRANA